MSAARRGPIALPLLALAVVGARAADGRAAGAAGDDPVVRLLAPGLAGEHAVLHAAAELAARGLRSAADARFAALAARGGARFADAVAALARGSSLPLDSRAGAQLAAELDRLPLLRLDERTRQALLQRLGVFFLRRGEIERADRLLARAGTARGRYLRGVLALHRGERSTARHLFGLARGEADAALLRPANPRARDATRDLRDLATLALARLSERVDVAARRYREIPYGSPHFFRARQELAWVALRAGQAAEALAQSMTLAAPSLARRYFRPDAAAVEAAALLTLCRFAEAGRRARQGAALLRRLSARLVVFLRPRPDVRLYYIDATASLAKRSDALPHPLGQLLLADPSFRRAVSVLRALQRERAALHHGAAPLRAALAAELDDRLVAQQQRAGLLVRRLLTATQAELHQLRLRCEELLFDAQRPDPPAGRRRTAARAAEQGLRWPFSGEHWPDEVADYRLSLPSRCP